MKNKITLFLGLLFTIGLIAFYFNQPAKKDTIPVIINKNTCLSDECLVVDDLNYPAGDLPQEVKTSLNLALEDEYKALTVYQKVIEKNGMVKPFSMIIRAEETHIASLKSLFDKYGLTIPVNNWSKNITVAASLAENCQIGVDAEIANVKLYREQLLPKVAAYPDISSVFTNLMNASEQKHLTAFNRCN